MVPGVEASPDKMLQSRMFSYPDTQRHRLGPNFQQLPINAPLGVLKIHKEGVRNEQRDGAFRVDGNQGRAPNYYPNSEEVLPLEQKAKLLPFNVEGIVDRYPLTVKEPNDFEQPRLLFRKVMKLDEQARLATNLINILSKIRKQPIKERSVSNFFKVDPDLGAVLASKLGLDIKIFGESIPQTPFRDVLMKAVEALGDVGLPQRETKMQQMIMDEAIVAIQTTPLPQTD